MYVWIAMLLAAGPVLADETLLDRLTDKQTYKAVTAGDECPDRIRLEKSDSHDLIVKSIEDAGTRKVLSAFQFPSINEGKKSKGSTSEEKAAGLTSKSSVLSKADQQQITSLQTFVSRDRTGELLSYKISTVLKVDGEGLQIRYKREHSLFPLQELTCLYSPEK